MVLQPNAVLGNAPKNPRFILYPRESAPSGPNTAEVENVSKYFLICLYFWYLVDLTNTYLKLEIFQRMPEQKPSKRLFLSQAAS